MTANLSPCRCGNTEFEAEISNDIVSSEEREIILGVVLTCTKCEAEYWTTFDLRRVKEK